MFAATLNRLTISMPASLGFRAAKRASQAGPMPTWINDPQLREKILYDTGLTLEDFNARPAQDIKTPLSLKRHYG